MKYAFASRTGNVEEIISSLGIDALRINDGSESIDEPYILFTYTDGYGDVPAEVENFSDGKWHIDSRVVCSGDTNYGDAYCQAADKISEDYGCEILYKVENSGTPEDTKTSKQQLELNLCRNNVLSHYWPNYCAPALKQYKYANMFHLPKDDDSIRLFIKQYNQQFNSKGIFFILIEQETQYTIYVYNSKLKDYISSNAVQNFLKSYQYPNTFELCIQELKKRLNTKNFPHEIGVFLGYPLDDVIGFIEHKPYYLIGDWKVYQNVNEAKKQFDLFNKQKKKC